jgi:DNA-binding response OmpR family regulator
MKQSLLIVEDDDATRSFLADNLAADGFAVASATGAAEGVRQIEVRHPSLVLLDLGLEEGNGLELLDRVRAADGMASRIDPDVPVIVITGRSGEADRVRGFARGADDFVVKPFSYSELLARVRAVLRRCAGRPQQGTLRVGDLVVDPSTRTARVADHRLHLSAKESRCCRRSPRSPAGCDRRTSSCATSGAMWRSAARAPWTRTRAGCERSSRPGRRGRGS